MEDNQRDPFDWGGLASSVLTTGGQIYTGILRRDIERQDTFQAQEAARIEAAKIQQEMARAEAEKRKAEGRVATIKAYMMPIAIAGVVIVGGIATYMYYKSK